MSYDDRIKQNISIESIIMDHITNARDDREIIDILDILSKIHHDTSMSLYGKPKEMPKMKSINTNPIKDEEQVVSLCPSYDNMCNTSHDNTPSIDKTPTGVSNQVMRKAPLWSFP
eukprot:GHVR01187196.1.p1 GENE.GHVR01187196.1~~GHVR01187196.1.p1  ORF type:complete len:115 (+),score=17.28 GHVR01187196.1:159-503(+)